MKKSINHLLIIISILMILTGVINDEHKLVMRKAIMVCLECIGIG